MDDVARQQALGRQQQIWANLYGASRAADLTDQLAALLGAEPALALRDAVARLDPEDAGQYEDFVATRW